MAFIKEVDDPYDQVAEI